MEPLDASQRLKHLHTVLGDLYGALNMPEPLRATINLYGEVFIPFHAPLNSFGVYNLMGHRMDIMHDENKLIDRKVSELKDIINSVKESDSQLEKEKKIKMIGDWVESLDTLKYQNQMEISSDHKKQILVGGVNGVLACSKTVCLLLDTCQQAIANPAAKGLMSKASYAALSKVLIPSGIILAIGMTGKYASEIFENTKVQQVAMKSVLAEDIKQHVKDRIHEKNMVKSVGMLTTITFGLVASQSLQLAYGFAYIIGALGLSLYSGTIDGNVSHPNRTLTMEDYRRFKSDDQLISFFRYADKDYQNLKSSIEFYSQKEPQKIAPMYFLSSAKNKLDFADEKISLFNDYIEILKKSLGENSDNGTLSKILKAELEEYSKLMESLKREKVESKKIYKEIAMLMLGLNKNSTIEAKTTKLVQGFSSYLNLTRREGIEADILNNMPAEIVNRFMEKSQYGSLATVKYKDILRDLMTGISQYDDARAFVVEYIKASSRVVKKKFIEPKKMFRDELLELIIAKNYVVAINNSSKQKLQVTQNP
jgi:hypothetical protein